MSGVSRSVDSPDFAPGLQSYFVGGTSSGVAMASQSETPSIS
jgi:hypothetical protein